MRASDRFTTVLCYHHIAQKTTKAQLEYARRSNNAASAEERSQKEASGVEWNGVEWNVVEEPGRLGRSGEE